MSAGRRRIDPLPLAVILSAVAVVAALVAAQVGQFGPMGTIVLVNLVIAAGALLLGLGRDRARNPRAAGAGILTVFAALGLAAWLWFSSYILFSDDVARTCATLGSDAGYRSTAEQAFVRSYVPPGLFCLPEGPGGPVVLGTDPGTVAAASLGLLVIAGCLAAALVLALRSGRPVHT